MTTVEYDLDVSGGIMPEIQALIGPPTTDESSKKHKKESQRSRRPGRTANHDCCDSCKEGGDLICCDRCPAAFHLHCYNPPLSDEDVPTGEWICNHCKIIDPQQPSEENSPISSNGYSNSKARSFFKGISPDRSFDKQDHRGMSLLIKAANTLNPHQFNVSSPLNNISTIFPGSSKRPRTKEGRTNNHKKLAHELDNGIVPLPAKICFDCKRSCRVAPLVQCDYCPLLFHMDCLNPPLTALPTGRWMCPNHVEQMLDDKLLTSISVTERIKLWDKFSGPINQDAIKLSFLRKINRHHPPFRFKVKKPSITRIQIPNAIKEMYNCPLSLLPRVTENPAPITETVNNPVCITPEEQDEWLTSMLSFQLGVVKHLAQRTIVEESERQEVPMDTSSSSPKMTVANGLPLENGTGPGVLASCLNCHTANTNTVSWSSPSHYPNTPSSKTATKVLVSSQTAKSLIGNGSNHNNTKPTIITSTISTPSTSRTMVSLQSSSTKGISPKGNPSTNLHNYPAILNLNNNLQASIEGAEGVILKQFDERLIRILAYQRLQQLLPNKNSGVSNFKKPVIGIVPNGPFRAILCPLTGKGPSVPMPHRKLDIGMSADMDLCLTNYGHCNFISAKHASIFYDEVTNHFELLNYSEHGTTVDNVLYSCDFSEKRLSAVPISPLAQHIKKLTADSSSPPSKGSQDSKDVLPRPTEVLRNCNCRVSSSCLMGGSNIGWEGTAILHQGSYIKCGCIQFAFSIIDNNNEEAARQQQPS